MSKQLRVDTDECIGCGNCEEVCPLVFKLGDDDKSSVLLPEGGGHDCVEDAIDGCPVEAISWQE